MEQRQKNEIETLKKEFEQTLETTIMDLKLELEKNNSQLVIFKINNNNKMNLS